MPKISQTTEKKPESEKSKSGISQFFNFLSHTGATALLLVSVWPFTHWFYAKSPALGVDFNLMATYVNYFLHHWAWPWNGWKYIWFGGLPLFDDYPALHFYLAVPFAHFFGVFRGVQIYLLFTLFLFLFFCYLLFWEISRQKILSLILAVSIGFSALIYGSLVFGGNGTFFASLFFVPLILYLIVKFYHRQKRSYLLWAAVFAGLSFIAHSGLAVYFIMPLSLILIFFWIDKNHKLFIWQKIKDLFIFGLITLLVGGAIIYYYVIYYTQTSSLSTYGNFSDWQARVEYMTKLAASKLIELDWLLLYGTPLILIAAIVIFILKKQKYRLKFILPFILLLIFLILFIYAPQRWGGVWRMFWAFPLVFGLIIAVSWRQIKKTFYHHHFFQTKKGKILSVFLSLVFMGAASIYFYFNQNRFFYFFDRTDLKDSYGQPVLNSRSIGSYPGLTRYPLPDQEIKEKIFPSWLDGGETNYRLYAMDATYNLWVNTYFEIPLVRGYVPAITSKLENWLYWSDTSLTKDDIVELHDVPVSFAKNYALFNIDWLAIKYLEGAKPEDYNYTAEKKAAGENPEDYYTATPKATRQYYGPLSSYLLNDEVIMRKQWWEDCQYFQVQDNLTSPIVKATDVPAVLVISDDEGYDVILKNIAIHNLNSQYLVPVHVNRIDDLKASEINNFEAVILYNYQYKNQQKAFALIDQYVKQGGHLYVETGSRSPQEAESSLPDFFPVYTTRKQAFEKNWQFDLSNDPLINGVEFDKFSEASYLNAGWGVSYSSQIVRDWATEVLSIEDNSVLVKGQYGKGEVIWSGFNLPYHILAYNNEKETQLFKNILGELVSLNQELALDYSVSRPASEKVVIEGKKANGLIFKESHYPGWGAKVKIGKQTRSLLIYSAGTDFMYVRLPEDFKENFTVTFSYRGTAVTWSFYIISFLTILFTVDYSLFKNRAFNLITFNIFARKKQKKGPVKTVASWWDDDQA
ncbi:MAG: hypothetical protein ABIH38_03985 [Patescibacteria group bacterium]